MEAEYFTILGLKPGDDEKKIKSAYRRLAFKFHPDRNPSPNAHQKFIAVFQAYQFLKHYQPKEKPISTTSTRHVTPVVTDPTEYQQYMEQWEIDKNAVMDKARKGYMEFVSQNSAYKQIWYYSPSKILAYFFYLLMLAIGSVLMLAPLAGAIYFGHKTLIILVVPLLIGGVIILKTAVYYKLRIDPYFDESLQ